MPCATLDYHAWQPLQHHLDSTYHVDSATWSVDIPHSDRDPFCYAAVSAEQRPHPPPNVFAILLIEGDSVDPNVRDSK
jgi:hypothetical protein